jgi:hypothetical protein
MIYVWTGQHLDCNFRAFCTFCTLMSRNISQEYSFFCKIFVLFARIFNYVIESVFIQSLIKGLLLNLVNNLVNILPDHFHCSCITYSVREIIPEKHILQTLFAKLMISSDFTFILHVFLAECVCFLTYLDELTSHLAIICFN